MPRLQQPAGCSSARTRATGGNGRRDDSTWHVWAIRQSLFYRREISRSSPTTTFDLTATAATAAATVVEAVSDAAAVAYAAAATTNTDAAADAATVAAADAAGTAVTTTPAAATSAAPASCSAHNDTNYTRLL